MFSSANIVSKLDQWRDGSCVSLEVYSVPKGKLHHPALPSTAMCRRALWQHSCSSMHVDPCPCRPDVLTLPLNAGSPNPKFCDVIGQAFTPTSVGCSFGPSWTTHWSVAYEPAVAGIRGIPGPGALGQLRGRAHLRLSLIPYLHLVVLANTPCCCRSCSRCSAAPRMHPQEPWFPCSCLLSIWWCSHRLHLHITIPRDKPGRPTLLS